MKKILRVKQPVSAPLNLTWVINNICPNKCSYCPSGLHNGSNHNYDWNNVKHFISELFERYSRIHCSISGGEPTMSPFLPELINIFNQNGSTISLTSNGYKTPDYWKEIAPKIGWIGFSYHPEFSTERYFENLNTAKHLTRCTARVMMLSSHWEHCVEVYEQLVIDDKHMAEPVRIVNWLGDINNGTDEYTQEQLEWFINNSDRPDQNNKTLHLTNIIYPKLWATMYMNDGTTEFSGNTVRYINNGQTNFDGYECEIGIKSLFIDHYGNIRRGNCIVGGTIGNINDPINVQWPDSPVTCNLNICHCSSDVTINKWINQ
jgi:organic radical activating enzyme